MMRIDNFDILAREINHQGHTPSRVSRMNQSDARNSTSAGRNILKLGTNVHDLNNYQSEKHDMKETMTLRINNGLILLQYLLLVAV
jgi:hypothetical protein